MTKRGFAAGLLGVAVALAACGARTDTELAGGAGAGSSGGSGSSSGSFPFGGPSCNVSQACWSCLGACPGIGCLATDCAAYFGCLCACAAGDGACATGCNSDITGACVSCQATVGTCSNGCLSQCSTSGNGSSGASGSGSGGSGSSGSGGGSSGGSLPGGTIACTGSVEQCAQGRAFEFCQDFLAMNCTAAYYQVGDQSFPCASCSDTFGCANAASGACQ